MGTRDDLVIAIPQHKGEEVIHIVDITHVQSCGSYAEVFLENHKKIIASKSIRYFEEHFGEQNFIRISRFYLVNIHHIARIYSKGQRSLELKNGINIPIARRKRAGIVHFLRGE